jgi:lipopolysaccharide biosynthesis regulator YciM
MPELLWLLLPVAAAAGWYAATRNSRYRSRCPDTLLGPEYFRGIDYLLNERPDKAIDVFIRVLEVTADTFETHLALGALFRRRGETDRAIRIHQNLVAREALSPEQRSQARLELGRDYLRAGLLDRAEELLNELVTNPDCRRHVLGLLLDIYQQERDWQRALSIAAQMEPRDEQPVSMLCGQFQCELAQQALAAGEPGRARDHLAAALDVDEDCARASIMLGDLSRDAGDFRAALASYARVERQDPERLSEVIRAMADCHERVGTDGEMIGRLQALIPRYGGSEPVLLLTGLLQRHRGRAAAADFLTRQLEKRPSVRGLARLIELGLADDDPRDEVFLLGLRKLAGALQENHPQYVCSRCGFVGKSLHWQCPGCRRWDTIRPVHGAQGV